MEHIECMMSDMNMEEASNPNLDQDMEEMLLSMNMNEKYIELKCFADQSGNIVIFRILREEVGEEDFEEEEVNETITIYKNNEPLISKFHEIMEFEFQNIIFGNYSYQQQEILVSQLKKIFGNHYVCWTIPEHLFWLIDFKTCMLNVELYRHLSPLLKETE